MNIRPETASECDTPSWLASVPVDQLLAGPASLSILVAIGNRIGRSLVVKILEREGHRVHPVATSAAAAAALTEAAFDLALLQVDLPDATGTHTFELYRAAIDRRPLSMVALVAEMTDEARAAYAQAGAEACIGMPVDVDTLLDIVHVRAGAQNPRVNDAADGPPAINRQTLDDLEKLGGREFVDDIVTQFIGDAARVQVTLAEAVAAADATIFQEQLHALRSCAANVGAEGIYKMCLAWREMDARELAARGKENLRRLDAEIARAGLCLANYLPQKDAGLHPANPT